MLPAFALPLALALALVAQPAPPAGAASAAFAWATSRDRLGAPIEQIARWLGPPAERSDLQASFRPAGCALTYWLDEQGRVKRIIADVTQSCHPAPEGVPVTPATTLGAVFRPGSHFGALCLGACGPPDTPTLVLGRIGRIDRETSWSLYFQAVDSRAAAAWLALLPASAADLEGRVLDARDPPPAVVALLRAAPIRRNRLTSIRRIEVNLFRPGVPPSVF